MRWKVLSSRTKAWSWGSWNPSIKTKNGVAFFVVASFFLFLEDSGSTDKENSDYYDDGLDFVRNHDLAEHCQHYPCRCSKLLVLSDWKYSPSIVCLREKYSQSTYFLGYNTPCSIKVLPFNAILKIERDYLYTRPESLTLERKLFQRNTIVFSNVLFWKKCSFANEK